MVDAAKQGAPIAVGVDHPELRVELPSIPASVARSLVEDLA